MSDKAIVLNEHVSVCGECWCLVPDSKLDLHSQRHRKAKDAQTKECPICSAAWAYTGRQHTIDSGTCSRYRCANGHILLVPYANKGKEPKP